MTIRLINLLNFLSIDLPRVHSAVFSTDLDFSNSAVRILNVSVKSKSLSDTFAR